MATVFRTASCSGTTAVAGAFSWAWLVRPVSNASSPTMPRTTIASSIVLTRANRSSDDHGEFVDEMACALSSGRTIRDGTAFLSSRGSVAVSCCGTRVPSSLSVAFGKREAISSTWVRISRPRCRDWELDRRGVRGTREERLRKPPKTPSRTERSRSGWDVRDRRGVPRTPDTRRGACRFQESLTPTRASA